MPKSGGWLARVKVVMGFVILAVMLKYLASIDQVLQWNFLTRERFLALWIVLFAMAGLYLLGYVRLEGVSKDEPLGLWRLLIGIAFLAFRHQPGSRDVRRASWANWTPMCHVSDSAGLNAAGGEARACLDEEPISAGPGQSAPRRQAGFRQFHRLRLHQLPLDEGQHVHAAGNPIGDAGICAGGTVHRRHR